ncbi:CpsD/CapB family tyrosine-protein kinase [Anaerobacillus sp. 1_MG-2023]|uniref:CpsD/CapB family tyrosine-protein kinase n=1 Tax=Bacillales TaxID=1385 RepID=UPI0026E1BEE6|nr:CpsD/CapB family tyrosine-protein kinase [Anaerobacillus sp. 1_MG-2023]MDO6657817.1 CpsD/CapB family tyrosine-protein kinase [Anaerobacillus sp. 1_MG-2023]
MLKEKDKLLGIVKKRRARDQSRKNQIKVIRAKLQKKQESPTSILVTTADKGFDHSIISYELAQSFATQGKKTILIDANFQEPVLHKWFDKSLGLGLINAIQRGNIQRYIIPTSHSNLSFLPFGTMTSHSLESWQSERLQKTIDYLKSNHDVVIFESPSYLTYSETQLLAFYSDDIIVVVKQHKDKISRLHQMKNDLKAVERSVAGVIYQSN